MSHVEGLIDGRSSGGARSGGARSGELRTIKAFVVERGSFAKDSTQVRCEGENGLGFCVGSGLMSARGVELVVD
jgi:hypothetical protein